MGQILFVDDDIYTLQMLSRAAEVLGHQALTATSVAEALKIVTEQRPGLVFTDLHLPDEDGASLLRVINSQSDLAMIPVYVLSASPAVDADERSRAAGAQAYLDKPLRIATLLDIIQKHGL